jgi:putative phosphoesterase
LPGGALALTHVAVISDTHLPRGTRRLPAECARLLGEADLVLHAGDLVAASVLAELSELSPVEAVAGNMDDETLRALLPGRTTVEIEGARIGMVHDAGPRAGREERLRAAFPGCAAVVYGHTHVPQLDLHGDVWILNPGSPTERRSAPSHSMALLRVSAGALQPRLVTL